MVGSVKNYQGITVETQKDQTRILGLDTVRAFSAISVLLVHILSPVMPNLLRSYGLDANISELSKYIFTGHPAVIVFFVVSGFCIHYPYTKKPLPVAAFILARWIRIMVPALIAIYIANFLNVVRYNFNDGYILWSIVCELWYYSLYPILLFLSRWISFTKQFYIAFIVSLLLVTTLGSDKYGNAHIYGPALNWLVALPSWLLGVMLATKVSSQNSLAPNDNCPRLCIYLWRITVAIVASALYWYTLNTNVGYYITMNIFAILVYFWIYAEIKNASNKKKSLSERVGVWSYSLYLFHILIYIWVKKYISSEIIIIPIILISSYILYIIIEKPSHEISRYFFKTIKNKYKRFTVMSVQSI